MNIIAETPRFIIRNFTPEDEKIYLSLFDNKEVTLHLPKRTKQENRQLFRQSLKEYEECKSIGRWGIFNKNDDKFIGICLLREYDNDKYKIELGYVLGQSFWGLGIAGEMALLMVGYTFKHTNALEIVAVTTLQNIASQKVLEKAGLKRQANLIRDDEELAFYRLERVL